MIKAQRILLRPVAPVVSRHGLASGVTRLLTAMAGVLLLSSNAWASIIGVSGPDSSAGTAPSIIAAPHTVMDDAVTNTGMQGFDEAQGVLTTVDHMVDGGVIPAGTLVDSHMIFLNRPGSDFFSHRDVLWTFSGTILGVMSDRSSDFEAASTFELGAPGTTYGAPQFGRGLEIGLGFPTDDTYTVSGSSLTIGMGVNEPGDWIRVVTATPVSVPEPGTLLLLGAGVTLAGVQRYRSRQM